MHVLTTTFVTCLYLCFIKQVMPLPALHYLGFFRKTHFMSGKVEYQFER